MDLDSLKLAFAAATAQRLVDADGVEDVAELSVFGELFSPLAMRQAGFVDAAGGFTEGFRQAFEEARRVLPTALPHGEKLELLSLLFAVESADFTLDPRETAVIADAARMLAITEQDLGYLLQRLHQE